MSAMFLKKRVLTLRGIMAMTALATAAAGLVSCTDDADTLYAGYRAFFRYTHTVTTPPLNAALGNPGTFCTVEFPGRGYRFRQVGGSSQEYNYTPSAADNYGTPEFIAGFIIGTPAYPDMSGLTLPVAFDLVCPNCFEQTSIQRSLSTKSTTEMKCNRCGRVYDLNNGGIVSSSTEQNPGGRALFRYRLTYSKSAGGGTLIIQN